MSLFDEVEAYLTGRQKAIHKPLEITEDVSYNNHFNLKEYRIKVSWGVRGFCEEEALSQAREIAIRQLRHHLYGDLIKDVLNLERALLGYDGMDREEMAGIITAIKDKIFNTK